MSRRRDRTSALGLLPRMEARPHKDGRTISYRYHPHEGKPIPLGTDKAEAIRKVLDLTGKAEHYGSLRWLWEQWKESREFKRLAEGTQADYTGAWAQIDPVLGAWPAASIPTSRISKYVHTDRRASPRRAAIEKAVISNLYKHGIVIGAVEANPTIGIPNPIGDDEDVAMPEPAAVGALLKWLDKQTPQRRIFACAAEFAALSGARQVEFLALVWPRVDEEAGVIRLTRAKQRGRKKDVVVDVLQITPPMKALLAKLRAMDRDGLYLFPTEDNNQYTSKGFKTMCQRVMARAIAAKVITPEQRFNFHGLRHYYTTHHKAKYGELPNLHADSRVTARVYDHTVEEHRRAL